MKLNALIVMFMIPPALSYASQKIDINDAVQFQAKRYCPVFAEKDCKIVHATCENEKHRNEIFAKKCRKLNHSKMIDSIEFGNIKNYNIYNLEECRKDFGFELKRAREFHKEMKITCKQLRHIYKKKPDSGPYTSNNPLNPDEVTDKFHKIDCEKYR